MGESLVCMVAVEQRERDQVYGGCGTMGERSGCKAAVMACSGMNLNFCINIQTRTLKMAGVIAKGNFPQDSWY